MVSGVKKISYCQSLEVYWKHTNNLFLWVKRVLTCNFTKLGQCFSGRSISTASFIYHISFYLSYTFIYHKSDTGIVIFNLWQLLCGLTIQQQKNREKDKMQHSKDIKERMSAGTEMKTKVFVWLFITVWTRYHSDWRELNHQTQTDFLESLIV